MNYILAQAAESGLCHARAESDAHFLAAVTIMMLAFDECRKIHYQGDVARRALDLDGGQRAAAALNAIAGKESA